MTPQLANFLNAAGTIFAGLLLFGVAYYFHSKLRMTRAGCVIAVAAGLVVFASPVGDWVNRIAQSSQGALWVTFVLVLIGIGVIIADIRGKKRGADKPALFAFYLVPVFLVAFLAALPIVFADIGDGGEKIVDRMSSIAER